MHRAEYSHTFFTTEGSHGESYSILCAEIGSLCMIAAAQVRHARASSFVLTVLKYGLVHPVDKNMG